MNFTTPPPPPLLIRRLPCVPLLLALFAFVIISNSDQNVPIRLSFRTSKNYHTHCGLMFCRATLMIAKEEKEEEEEEQMEEEDEEEGGLAKLVLQG